MTGIRLITLIKIKRLLISVSQRTPLDRASAYVSQHPREPKSLHPSIAEADPRRGVIQLCDVRRDTQHRASVFLERSVWTAAEQVDTAKRGVDAIWSCASDRAAHARELGGQGGQQSPGRGHPTPLDAICHFNPSYFVPLFLAEQKPLAAAGQARFAISADRRQCAGD